jgi:hypothetical protein
MDLEGEFAADLDLRSGMQQIADRNLSPQEGAAEIRIGG